MPLSSGIIGPIWLLNLLLFTLETEKKKQTCNAKFTSCSKNEKKLLIFLLLFFFKQYVIAYE